MIAHVPRERPNPWRIRRKAVKWRILLPLVALEWSFEWLAYALSHWSFLEVLEYLGTFSVLVAVIFYFAESGDRIKLRHYQAWQVINTAQGKGGSGGRIDALEELNADKVLLVGVDVSSAFLQGLDLHGADLTRSNFSGADIRYGNFTAVNFTFANLNSANFRNALFDRANLTEASLRDADLTESSLRAADLTGATLDDCDLVGADLKDVNWKQVKSMKNANIVGVRNAPQGFVDWALSHGAVSQPAESQ